jgi:hypothetical protein
VFSHIHNTFDKRKLLDSGQHPDFFKESPKTVDQFIRNPREAAIKQFFMTDIDSLLQQYKPGEPNMKPDVIKQMKELDEERAKMIQQQQQGTGQLMMQRDGQPPVALTNDQVIQLITDQQNKLKEYEEQIKMLIQNPVRPPQESQQIMMNQEGKPPVPLTKEQIIQIMTDQQTKIHSQQETIKTLQLKLEMALAACDIDNGFINDVNVP